jgi:hypothetical protein
MKKQYFVNKITQIPTAVAKVYILSKNTIAASDGYEAYTDIIEVSRRFAESEPKHSKCR